jgi:D-glucosaminate-specific PTS system IIB component
MTGPALVRVDDRLIHGQVVTAWVTMLKCREIIVVDDDVARDAFLSEIIRLAAPADTRVNVLTIQDSVKDLSQFNGTLVLLKTPHTALALRQAGVPFDQLVLGGMGARADRKPLYRNISVSGAELAALKEIKELGVEPVCQIVPTDRAVPLSQMLK